MATTTATMKSFTKGLQLVMKPMEKSLANIEQSLTITASREDIVEENRAEKVKIKEEKKQTSILEKLSSKKDDEGKGGFFGKHWGKILLALIATGLLLTPKGAILDAFSAINKLGKLLTGDIETWREFRKKFLDDLHTKTKNLRVIQ
jgi:hypothetical protein